MYADKITDSMRVAIDETKRRRKVQEEYNEAHGITPQTIQKSVRDLIAISKKVAADENALDKDPESMSKKELEKHIADIEKKMKKQRQSSISRRLLSTGISLLCLKHIERRKIKAYNIRKQFGGTQIMAKRKKIHQNTRCQRTQSKVRQS